MFELPRWSAGERRVYVRGDVVRLELRVEADGEGYRLIDDQSGLETLYGPSLQELGQRSGKSPEIDLSFDPADYQLTWPLWVGKRWTGHFVARAPDRPDSPWIAEYHCDAIEDLDLPVGKQRCLRIWRGARPALAGAFAERTSVVWLALELGCVVRRLSDGLQTDLIGLQRP